MPRLSCALQKLPGAGRRPRLAPWLLAWCLAASGLVPWAQAAAQPLPDCASVIRASRFGSQTELHADCVTAGPIDLPNGQLFDGNGHSIHVVDPPGGRFSGAVLVREGGSAAVADVTIDGSGLGGGCPDAPYLGVLLARASGRVSGVRVKAWHRASGIDCAENVGLGIGLLGHSLGPTTAEGNHVADAAFGLMVSSRVAALTGNRVERAAFVGIAMYGGDSRIDLTDNVVTSSSTGVGASEQATVRLRGDRVVGPSETGLDVSGGANVTATGIEITDADIGADTYEAGSTLTLGGANVGGTNRWGVVASDAGVSVVVDGGRVTGSTVVGVLVQKEATLRLRTAQVGAAGKFAALGLSGATIEVRDAELLEGGLCGFAVGGAGTVGTLVGSRVAIGARCGAAAEGGAAMTVRENTIGPLAEVASGAGIGSATPSAGSGATPLAGTSSPGTPSAGVLVRGRGTRAEVADNLVVRPPDDGIEVREGATGRVTGNVVLSAGDTGIVVVHQGPAATVADNRMVDPAYSGITVEGGTAELTGNRVEGAGSVGILARSRATARVGVGNRVVGGRDGIVAVGAGTTATISGNSVERSGNIGIWVQAGALGDVVDNTVAEPGGHGIVVTGAGTTAAISRNRATGSGRSALMVEKGARAALDGNLVALSGTAGIYVTGAGTEATLNGNRVADAGKNGIEVANGAWATIADSDVANAQGAGISLFSGATAEARGNRVRGGAVGLQASHLHTRATFVGNTVLDPTDAGVLVSDGATAEARDNAIDGGEYGVRVWGSGSQATVAANRVSGSATAGIGIRSGASATLAGNVVAFARAGVSVSGGATAEVNGGNRVLAGAWGISVGDAGSVVTVDGATVLRQEYQSLTAHHGGKLVATNVEAGSAAIGAFAATGGTVELGPGTTIGGTTRQGVLASGAGSTLRLRGVDLTTTKGEAVTANEGGRVELTASRVAFAGTTDNRRGITAYGPGTELVMGDSRVTADGGQGAGVTVWLGASASVTGSTIRAATGIRVVGDDTRADVRDTTIEAATAIGIEVGQQATATLSGNRVTGSPRGIEVDAATATVTGNAVALGPLAEPPPKPPRGILVSGGTVTLRDNAVSGYRDAGPGKDGCGIWLGPFADATLDGNRFPPPGNATDLCDLRVPLATPVAAD